MLAAALYDHGLLEEKIETNVERHGDELTIDFAVVDGRVYRYGKVDVRGNLAAPKAAYLKLATLKRGAVFSRSEVTKVLDAVRALDTSQGRPDLEVEPETELDPKTGTVALVISVKSPPGFAVTDLKPGAGRMAKRGDTASVRYTGSLPDGTVFDTNVGKSPFDFKLGGGQVIAGFERGVLGMKVGGKRRVTIPPDSGLRKTRRRAEDPARRDARVRHRAPRDSVTSANGRCAHSPGSWIFGFFGCRLYKRKVRPRTWAKLLLVLLASSEAASLRSSGDSLCTRTLMSSCVSRAARVASTTPSVIPSLPIDTTGESSCPIARR